MLQIILQKLTLYIRAKNRWWLPIITGLLFSLSQPPFNHELNPVFVLFPLLTLVVLIPLFLFATTYSLKRAMVHTGLFGFFASISQYFWIGFVTAEGLWHLILIGVVLIALFIGSFYFMAGMLFRFFFKRLPRLYLLVFPAVWVGIDYLRTLGEISFPWEFLGYSMIPFTPLVQIASVTGVWGLTFIVVFGNLLIWELLRKYRANDDIVPKWKHVAVFILLIVMLSVWGHFRTVKGNAGKEIKVSLLQPNLDQLNWGTHSLDSAITITDSMVFDASLKKPDVMIAPESALLCFLARRPEYRSKVEHWVDSTGIPILLGALHWEKAPDQSYYDYFVYNSAFLFKPGSVTPLNYNKIKLVAFSEALPFEGVFPILSRTNLGEADFQRGKEQTVFTIGDSIKAAPFICYEIIYPGFVQQRLKKGSNLIVTITNDGWFGKTTGPYHHASMARMRAVENGRPLVRSANSGISMIVDKYGREKQKTNIYERTTLTGTMTLDTIDTIYLQWGDWFVALCGLIIGGGLLFALFSKTRNTTAKKSNVVS